MTRLVLATNNRHKILEIRTILKDLDLEILTLQDIPGVPPLIEDGETFEENALQKARIVHRHSKFPTLADDSGLEVFYLNGKPGVFSARYSGERATDEKNNEKLLSEMRGVAPRRRRAQFRSVIAFVNAGSEEVTVGICPGNVAEKPRGTNGFGYDPIFVPDGFDKTYAELTAEQKNTISHRAQSLARMKKILLTKFPSLT